MKQTMKLLLSMLVLMLCLGTAAALADGESETPVCTHPGISYQETKAATCTEDGSEEGTCPKCNVTVTALIKAGHTACGDTCTRCKEYIAHSPSEDGSVCTTCGAGISSSCEHISVTKNKAPTCTEDGFVATVCSKCGLVLSNETIPAGHNYVNGKCTVCGGSDPNAGSTECTEHKWGTTQATIAPTCTEDGEGIKTCIACGATEKVILGAHHRTDETSQWQSNGSHHWKDCTGCGEDMNVAAHIPSEADPTKCSECGGTISSGEGESEKSCLEGGEHSYDLKFDSDQHWYECKYCKTLKHNGKFIHEYTCTVRDRCATCGVTNPTSVSELHQNWSYRSNDTQHWRYCSTCFLEYQYEEHYISCNDPTTCAYCDATQITGTTVGHNWDYNSWAHDDTHHWHTCKNCDEITAYNTHYSDYCTDTTCSDCGQSGVTISRANHSYDFENWHYDETNHWHECKRCKDVIGLENHFFGSTDCFCGATSPDTECTNHDYKYVPDGEYHRCVCSACGVEDEDARTIHTITCMDDTKCSICGGTQLGDTFFMHADPEPRYTNTHHYAHCNACNTDTESFAHVISCKNEGVCVDCHATGVTGMPGHNWDYEYATNGTHHWYECSDCGTHSQEEEHWKFCNAEGDTCQVCRASGVTCKIQHEWDWGNFSHDDDAHWVPCLHGHSDAKLNHSSHVVTCADPTTCTVCGATGITGRFNHVIGSNTWQSTDTECWFICSVCDQEANRWKHSRSCQETACTQCGRTDVTFAADQIGHGTNITSIWHTTEENHWQNCIFCGEPINPQPHTPSEDGVCTECGKTGLSTEDVPTCTEHTPDWERGYEWDADKHYLFCAVCKQQMLADGHVMGCDSNYTSCVSCGVKGVNAAENVHLHMGTLSYDATHHWDACFCGEEVSDYTEHTFVDGVCECGQTEAAECAHEYSWVVVVAANCTKDGQEKYICTKCDTVAETKVVWAYGHNWATTSTDATCTTPGQERVSCTRCGDVQSNASTPALGHDYITTTQDATCTENGLTTTVCSRCGDVQSSKVLPMTGHNRMFRVTNAATCTAKGTRVWYCDNCRLVMEQEEIPAKGHSLVTTETDTATVVKCSRCDYEKVTPKATATPAPTAAPTATPAPTEAPTAEPTLEPTAEPTLEPTIAPAELPKDVVVKPVEDVVIEVELPVEEETDAPETEGDAEEPKPEVKQVKITVSEVAMEETPVVLPLPVEIEPTKVITIQMDIPEVTENEKVAIPEKVKVALPMTEVEIAELANTKLVLVLEDGTMVEIPYEVVDGKVVFTTERMGVFAFVPVEE